MEFIFHFIFTLIKISVLTWAYTAAFRSLFILYGTLNSSRVLAWAITRTKRFWWYGKCCIWVGLFVFSFTYWGNHGLGDYARIPLGNWEAMQEINGVAAYFEAEVPLRLSTDQPFINLFQVGNEVLCGQASDKSFFTYDLVTKQQRIFGDSLQYATYAAQHRLPATSEFKPFGAHYDQYWGGWRFWLLA